MEVFQREDRSASELCDIGSVVTSEWLGVGRHGATPTCGLECSQEEYGEVVELLVLEECIDRCVEFIFWFFFGIGSLFA